MVLAKPGQCEERKNSASEKNQESVTFENIKKQTNFDVGAFRKRALVAEWLFRYDQIAWKTTDMLVKEAKETVRRLAANGFALNTMGHGMPCMEDSTLRQIV